MVRVTPQVGESAFYLGIIAGRALGNRMDGKYVIGVFRDQAGTSERGAGLDQGRAVLGGADNVQWTPRAIETALVLDPVDL